MCSTNGSLYRLLDYPPLYRLLQTLLAPGTQIAMRRKIRELLTRLPAADLLLDVGCGPASRLWSVGLNPTGIDMSLSYIREYARRGHPAVVASADALPFADRQFDGVWSVFLLHHLTDRLAHQAVREMIRVCRPGGYLVILDDVWPHVPWQRPTASLIRRLDRGSFIRREQQLASLLSAEAAFHTERITYSLHGLEMLVCSAQIGSLCH